SPPWNSTCSAPKLGGGLEVKGHWAVPEAEAHSTSASQQAAMLERRRRRRGAKCWFVDTQADSQCLMP
ncbi:hypothetical protein U0070_022229, partial [Myodes glareolus]